MRGFNMGTRRGMSVAIALAIAVSVLSFGTVVPAFGDGVVTLSHGMNWGSNGVSTGLPPGTFHWPRDVAADKWGNVYVTGGGTDDYRVQMFTSSGVFVRSIGTTGSAAPYLSEPRMVTTDRWGGVYVAEGTPGNRISVWNPRLYVSETPTAPVRAITGDNTAGLGDIFASNGLAVSLGGDVYSSESTKWLQRFSRFGVFRNSWTASGPPLGVAVSQDDSVYAVTMHAGTGDLDSVLRYRPAGTPLGHWGGTGTDAGQLSYPYDIGVDGGGHVFTLEASPERRLRSPGQVGRTPRSSREPSA